MKYIRFSFKINPVDKFSNRRNPAFKWFPLKSALIFPSFMSGYLKPAFVLISLLLMSVLPFVQASASFINSQVNQPPNAVCKNISVYLGTTGTVTIAGSDIDGGSNDPDGTITSLMASPNTFACSETGINTVTLTVTDNEGLSAACTSQVTVLDNLPPTVNVKTFHLILGPSGTATLLPSDVNNGTFDNCGPVTLSVSPDTFTCSDAGKKIVALTATDSHGNSASRNVTITVSSSLEIISMSLNNCNLAVSYSLYMSETEGGDGNYSYFWKGINETSKPFLVVLPIWPYLQFSNTSTSETPYLNNTMPAGPYGIRLIVTDGNGCKDTSDILINMTGPLFDNKTYRDSKACKDEIRTYSVIYEPDATYSWIVQNGTIMNSDTDTSRISVLWNTAISQGIVIATVTRENLIGETCVYSVIDTVSIETSPVPAFNSPAVTVCSNSENTYFLTDSYAFHNWNVTGGNITGGGTTADNFVTVRWGEGPAGNVTVTVENASSCSGSVFVNISISDLTGTITSLTDVTCNGASDGTVTASATAGSGVAPYEYSLDGGSWQPGGTFTGISQGNHTVSIRDASLCTSDLPFVINQPSPLAGAVSSQTDVSCFGGSNGSVIISSSGGVSPYVYSLNGGLFQSSNTFSGLSAGSYTIMIRDNNSCQTAVPVVITQPAALTGSIISQTNVNCFGAATGSVTISGSGGTSPYEYSLDPGVYQSSGTFTNLVSGTHSVTIRDANMCLFNITVNITQPASALLVTCTSVDVGCFGGSTGSALAIPSGGTSPYQYSWNTVPVQTTADASGLAAGNYTVTVNDNNGCVATTDISIIQPSAGIAVTASVTDVMCFGTNTGAIDLTVENGTAPITYLWSNGASSEGIVNITAGTYSVIVTDANNCTTNGAFEVNEPLTLSVTLDITNVACFGESSGNIDLTVSGATPPYSYLWNNGAITEDLTGLTADTYSVTISDANSCIMIVTGAVTQPVSSLGGTITSQTDVSEYGGSDGSVTVTGSGGTLPYSYRLGTGTYQSSGTFNNLIAGTYTVTIRDDNLCIYDVMVIITQPMIPLTGNISSQTNILCYGVNSGSVTVTGWGGTSPYEYSINGGAYQPSGIFGSLAPGTYLITVRDAVMDTFDIPVTITEPGAPLSIIMNQENVRCSGDATGSASVTVTGGVTPYTYSWNTSPAQTNASISGLTEGSYSVIVTDANGCTLNGAMQITEPQPLAVSATTTNASCPDEPDGSIILQLTGGVAPYTVIWSDGVLTQNRGNIMAGTYSAVVTDQNSCAKSVNVEVGFAGTFNCVVIPQLITPNNDGYNDEWIQRNIEIYPNAEVLVYNRWGKLVFRTKNISANPWDGRENGKLVPADSYHYILYLNDGSAPRSGVISVIR